MSSPTVCGPVRSRLRIRTRLGVESANIASATDSAVSADSTPPTPSDLRLTSDAWLT